jgi:hypothetical protein
VKATAGPGAHAPMIESAESELRSAERSGVINGADSNKTTITRVALSYT